MTSEARHDDEIIREEVRRHYAELATRRTAGGSSSCCSSDSDRAQELYDLPEVNELPQAVRSLAAGCGDPISLAELQAGQVVLDLGSGGGIDCFLAAQKVGPTGHVVGIDMTIEMIKKAESNREKIGAENVDFRLGQIEDLPVEDQSIDVIISNCVINLSPDKPQVLREAYRVLRPGGKIAFSDIVADGPLPTAIENNLSAWSGCLAGAMDYRDWLAELEAIGFVDINLTRTDEESKDEGHELTMAAEAEDTAMIHLNESWVVMDLDGRKAPFSARITARRPAN
jgi:SAM-dependent methyltransferase